MADLSGFDAAYPPSHPPADQVVMGYLGGNTPHVWTPAEWGRQSARYRIGVWTRSDPVGAAQGKADARAAVAAWRSLGAPAGTLIVLDLETAVAGAYVAAFDAQAVGDGFKVAAYGSKDTLFKNPKPSGGYFTADLTNSPHLYPGTTITQWEFESGWDDDELSAAIVGWLWDTRPASTPPAPSAHALEEDTMRQQLVYDPAHKQQHFIYIAGGAVFHRVFDEATRRMSEPNRLPGTEVNPDAGVSAALMMGGAQLHVFAEYADTTHGTGAHYWLTLPADVTKPESWGEGVI